MVKEQFYNIEMPNGILRIHVIVSGGYIEIRFIEGILSTFEDFPNVCTIRDRWVPFIISALKEPVKKAVLPGMCQILTSPSGHFIQVQILEETMQYFTGNKNRLTLPASWVEKFIVGLENIIQKTV